MFGIKPTLFLMNDIAFLMKRLNPAFSGFMVQSYSLSSQHAPRHK